MMNAFNIDAEDADRLEISFDLLDRLLAAPDLANFNGIRLVYLII
ncbi:hypothetical protein ACWIT3_06905 [Pasteurella sp. P03HT]